MAETDLPVETFDASDPAAEDNAKRDAARVARQDADVIRKLLHDKDGRAWFYRHLQSCHIFGAGRSGPVEGSTFAPGQSDVTAYRLGEENIGKRLMMQAMDASPDLYLLMIKEQRAEDKRLDEVRRTERKNRDAKENPELTPLPRRPTQK